MVGDKESVQATFCVGGGGGDLSDFFKTEIHQNAKILFYSLFR